MSDMTSDAATLRPQEIPDDSTFGARLAMVRQRRGWNMKEAARAAGVPHMSWVGWETRGMSPRRYAQVTQQISEAAGVSLFWLMTGAHPKFPNQVTYLPVGDEEESPFAESNRRPSHYKLYYSRRAITSRRVITRSPSPGNWRSPVAA